MGIDKLKSVGQIRREQGLSESGLEYILASRRIKPDARVGQYRLFGPAAVERIKAARKEIQSRRKPVTV